jgi:8-oxo-dGTP pyrophosphatase MutT (NUDIX family)
MCRTREMNTATARHSVSVAGVITDDDGRALFIRRRDTLCWEPPGGVLELDESIEAGLREVREETGLAVEPVALTGVYKNMARGIALVFRCNVVSGHLTLNEPLRTRVMRYFVTCLVGRPALSALWCRVYLWA